VRRPDDVRAGRAAARLRPKGALSLARALSKFGVCSRREAERWIAEGRVEVDGRTERTSSRWIDPGRSRVSVDRRPVGDGTQRVVIAFHKPAGLITTRVDPGGRSTVYDALGDVGRWLFPVGRLDRDSSGLLVLTNDHRLGERLTSPEAHVPKTYHARVAGVPEPAALRALREGVTLEDGLPPTRPAGVRVLGSPRAKPCAGGASPASTWLEVVLTEGRNRQVRRMCALVGHDVLELVRVGIGRLQLSRLGLASGQWRELTGPEIEQLAGGR
jgi:23S rRNA pseudouridine2605 synthase